MVLDRDLLVHARATQAAAGEAEQQLSTARRAFHASVADLSVAGGSRREIAAALGLSHQRVHQIVDEVTSTKRPARRKVRSAPRCSFCDTPEDTACKLIAGPGCYICDRCMARADRAMRTGQPQTAGSGTIEPVSASLAPWTCTFCRKKRSQVPAVARLAGARTSVCAECLALCLEIVREEFGESDKAKE